jgi:bacterioferritin-associated ferredoxin
LNNKSVPDPLKKLPTVLKQNLDKNLCICMDVPRMDIINAIADGADTVEEVKRITSATMGSQCCVQQVERLIECIHKPERRMRRRKEDK